MSTVLRVKGFELQGNPRVYLAAVWGRWLLKHTTPSWRIEDPERGFQRIVREERARQIAATVIDQGRTFPNAIVLATDRQEFSGGSGSLKLPSSTKLLVVDGQHRLWAQKFTEQQALYPCLIHMGLTEVEMAKLFLEINDNQKRVPASLRWDLVRLVRPEGDEGLMRAVDVVFLLATEDGSPLFQRIDLTGEQQEIRLKQASLAPELRILLRSIGSPLKGSSVEEAYLFMSKFFTVLRALDPGGWKRGESVFYKARIVRALLRLVPEIVTETGKTVGEATAKDLREVLAKVDPATLTTDEVRAAQGSAGISAIAEIIRGQIRS